MPTPKKNKSALSEKTSQHSQSIGAKSAARIKALRKKRIDATDLAQQILAGNKTALSQGITLVESKQEKHFESVKTIINTCLPASGKSIRIGITGVPGVGKSTFIEAFGNYLIEQHAKKVAVLAVDPTSSVSHGSILGDKTRMEELVKQENAFIRPTASGDSLGGVAQKTRESVILCEAAGFDVILIETVGVGQSETLVHSMTDFFLLLKLAGAGDELQGIKRGIMEMADAIVINKADGENLKPARQAQAEFKKALHLYPTKESTWKPLVKIASGLHQKGIDRIWEMLETYFKLTKGNGYFEQLRLEQNKHWLLQTIQDQLKADFYANPKIKQALAEKIEALERQEVSPFEAAFDLLQLHKEIS